MALPRRQVARVKTNVGNDALYVIYMDPATQSPSWEVAKVALSCHIALDMLCQEMHEVERRTWLVRVLSASGVTEGEGSE